VSLWVVNAVTTATSDQLDQLSEELDQSAKDLEKATEDLPDMSDSSSDQGSSTASGDRSPEFCEALNKAATTPATFSDLEIGEETKQVYKNLAEISSPNQDLYKKFYGYILDPTLAATDTTYVEFSSDFATAMGEDFAACV
jgi:ABC-type transporter Mla subunit MlaD